MLALWRRLPVILRASSGGLTVAFIGVTVWGGIGTFPGLAGLNLRVMPQVPWAVAPMTVFLFFYWRYLNGAGWPRGTSDARRHDADDVSDAGSHAGHDLHDHPRTR